MLLMKDFMNQNLIDSLEKLRIDIRWLAMQIMWTTFDDGFEYTNHVAKSISDIRNTAIKDLSPNNVTTEQRTMYLGLLMSFIVREDRFDGLDEKLEKALETQKEWEGFLFYDLFFLLIRELQEMINMNMTDVKDVWHKYRQIKEQYLLERNNKIDDFSGIKNKMLSRVRAELDNQKETKE